MFTGFANLKENITNLSENIYSMTDILKKENADEVRILF